jgi:hypothetical protein
VAGDAGTVVHVHRGGEGYEVEFVTLAGRTVGVLTLPRSAIRTPHGNVAVHARVTR